MHRLFKPTLGVLFVILSSTTVLAGPQPLALSTPQALEPPSPAAERGAVLAVSQRLDGAGGYAGRFSSAAAPAAVAAKDSKPNAPSSTNGLSMLAALVIMGGFVVRRFLR